MRSNYGKNGNITVYVKKRGHMKKKGKKNLKKNCRFVNSRIRENIWWTRYRSNMDVEEIDMDSHRYVMIPSFINGTSYNGTLRNEFQVEVSF